MTQKELEQVWYRGYRQEHKRVREPVQRQVRDQDWRQTGLSVQAPVCGQVYWQVYQQVCRQLEEELA